MSNSRELSKLGSYVDVIDDVLIFDATNTSIEGVDISGLEAAVALNTVKVSNVTTDLTFSRSATTLTVVSSDGTDAILPSATLTLAGMMSAADKTSLTDHLSSSSNPHSVTKTQIGLGSVDNTSDAAKPVSTAQQTALNLKANLVSPALTGTPSAPTATTGTSTTQIATTAFVLTELAGIAQYSHPSDGVDLGIALTGATVISDVNVNAAGHVTGFATRNLTAANIGAQASGSYSLTSHNHSGVYQPIATVLTNTTASYTTAEQTKLSGIEAGATADQTKIDIDALNINADTLDGQHGAYYTNYVDTAITSILNAAPATLDTLNELAAALGDDPNFATTMTTALAGKVDDAQVLTDVPAGALFTDTNTWRPIDDVAVNGATTESISSNWAFDHAASSTAHPRDTRNQIAGSYQPLATVLTNTTASYTTAEETKLAGIATSANNYSHPTGGVGLAAQSGATVVSSITVNSLGHTTAVGTRELTAANIGAAASSHTHSGYLASTGGTLTGKLLVQNSGVVSPVYTNGQFELQSTDGNDVSMGFNRSGFSACQLRHSSNGLILSGTTRTNAADFIAYGDITAYSDKRLKDNIEIIPKALDKVMQLNGYTFTRTNAENGNEDKRQTGVIAQEVLEVLPEAVSTDDDGYHAVAYGNMVGLLIEAIKELKQEIEVLKNGV